MQNNRRTDGARPPKISVIIPVYNCDKYIEKCIDSVLNQTYGNLELIIIDDGSTDSTGAICDAYAQKDRRVRTIHKVNEGQGVARNAGLDICHGEYIAFVDGDDTVLPDMFETMLRYLTEENADVCMCGFLLDDGLRIQRASPFDKVAVLNNGELMREYVTTSRIHRGPCNKLFDRRLFKSVRFPALRAHEDAYIMHRLLGKAKAAVCIPDCLYRQYIRQESTENSPFSGKKLAALDCSDSLMSYYRNHYSDLYSYVAYYKADSLLNLLQQILISFSYSKNKQLYKDLYEKMKTEYANVSRTYRRNEDTDSTRKAVEHPFAFKITTYVNAVNRRIRRKVKRILVKRNKV